MELKEVIDTVGVFNALDKTVGKYTTEFTVTQWNKNGSYDIPYETYSDLSDALAYCKEVYDTDKESIEFFEITLETTAWYMDENDTDLIPDTVGEVTVAYYKE